MRLRFQIVTPRQGWKEGKYTYNYSDGHGERRNHVACSWMFACEETRGMWCGGASVRMRVTLSGNGN